MADVKKTVEIALNIIGTDTKILKGVQTAFENIQKTIKASGKAVEDFQTKLNSLKAPDSLKKISDAFKNLKDLKLPSLNSFTTNIKKLDGLKIPSFTSLINQLTKLSAIDKFPSIVPFVNGLKQVSSLRIGPIITKIKELNAALIKLEARGGISAFKNFASDVSGIKTAFSSAEQSMRSMTATMKQTGQEAQATGLKLGSFAEKVKTVLQFRLISEALVNLKTAVGSGVTAIIEYDQSLKDLQAITGATTLEVAQMGMKILEVASTTKFSATEVAQGMRTIGQAGFSASEAVETMQAVSDLATGTLSDMKTTVDLVTTAMRVFQIDATRSAEIADVFANSVNKSKLTIDKLRTAMNYIGPIARDAGVSFKELSASMATLANSGLRASTIGTGLRRVFAELIDPSKKLKDAARAAGVALNELDPRSTSLSEVMRNLSLVVNDAQVAFDVFGKRGAASVLALSNSGSKFQEMLGTISQSGTAALQASIQMEGLGVSFKNLQDKIGLFAIAIGEAGIADAMRIVINVSRDFVDIFTTIMSNTFTKFIIKSALVVGAILAISKAILFLGATASFSVLTTAFSEFASIAILAETSVAGLIATMAPLILLFGALAAGAYLFFSSLDGSKKAADDASKLADKYSILSKKLKDYRIKVNDLKEGSKELKEANLALRDNLKKTASEFPELASLAYAASSSINSLTGVITKGSTALEIYKNKLNELTSDKLVESAKHANNVLKEQSGYIQRLINKYKDLGTQTYKLLSGQGFKFLDFGNMAAQADAFARKLARGAVTFKELREEVLKYDAYNMTSQQDDIFRNYERINDQADLYIKHLEETNEIAFDDTIEHIEKLLVKAKYGGTVLSAMLLKITEIQEAQKGDFTNIIEKWGQDTDPNKVVAFIDEYKKLGGLFEEGNEAQIKSSALAKKKFVEDINRLKVRQKEEQAAGESILTTWQNYERRVTELLVDAGNVREEDSKNRANQNIKALLHEFDQYKKHLDDIAELYEGNHKKIAHEQEKEYRRHLEKIASLTTDFILDPKEQTKLYTEGLKEREVSHAKTLSNIAKLEKNKYLTEAEADKRRLNETLVFHAISLKNAQDYYKLVADNEKQPEEQEKRYKILLAVEKKYYDQKAKYSKGDFKLIKEEETKTQKEQTQIYEQGTKERESLLASYIATITKLEAGHRITEEAAEKQRLLSTLNFYKQSLAVAKDYLSQVDVEVDPDEYDKRYKVVLAAKKKFFEEEASFAKDSAELNEELEQAKADKTETISKALYKSAIKKQREASKTLNAELKASYDTDLQAINEYYVKKRLYANEDIDAEKDIIADRIKQREKEFDVLIEATNSLVEKETLRGQKIAELLKLETKLENLETGRPGTLAKIAAEEDKVTEATKRRIDTIIDSVTKKTEASEADLPGVTFDEKFQLEIDALKRFHADQLIELERWTQDELVLKEQKALQEMEIENKITAHEKEQQDLRISSSAQFAGDMSSIAKDLLDSGLIRSKEAFKAYQAFAIAESTIATYSAATKAYDAAMEIGGPFASVFAWTASLAAIAKGMANVAVISKQTPGYKEGGRVRGPGGPVGDKIHAMLSDEEFVEPAKATRHYGMDVFEGLRTLSIPKSVFNGFKNKFQSPPRSDMLARGGVVSDMRNSDKGGSFSVTVPVSIQGVGEKIARILPGEIEDTVIRVMRREMA